MYRILLVVTVLAATAIVAPLAGSPAPQPVTIPVRQEQKLLYLQVTINGHGPFWFCLDTGAHRSVIDPFLVKELGLTAVEAGSITGTGQGNVSAQKVGALQMRLGALAVNVPEPLVIDLSNVPIPHWVHGLVGAELLDSHVVEIDTEKSTLRVFDPEHFSKPANATSVPLIAADHRFYLDVTLDVAEHETVTHRVRIDTGSADSVADDIVKGASNVRTTTLGNGLGENFKGVSGTYKAVHLGPFEFRNVWGPGSPHPGIGMEMMRRFKLTFDVPHRALYLEPNSHYRDPFPAPNAD